jgi:hypothetical protein
MHQPSQVRSLNFLTAEYCSAPWKNSALTLILPPFHLPSSFSASAPVFSSTRVDTEIPDLFYANQVVADPATCAANPDCSALLGPLCCPTPAGVMLDCCLTKSPSTPGKSLHLLNRFGDSSMYTSCSQRSVSFSFYSSENAQSNAFTHTLAGQSAYYRDTNSHSNIAPISRTNIIAHVITQLAANS